MKKSLLALCATLAFLPVSIASAQDITLTTEDYKPYNFMDGDKIVGVGADQVFELMARSGLSYSAEMMQWSRAIGLAENQPNTCVFTASHTAERDARFVWIEPLVVDRAMLVRKKGADVTAATLEEAKAYTVGTQAKDYTEDLLKGNGFTKIDLAANFEQTMQKLQAGRIDMTALSETYMQELIANGAEIEPVTVLSETILSMACSKSTDADKVAKMQDALKSMIDDGTQAEIIAKYK